MCQSVQAVVGIGVLSGLAVLHPLLAADVTSITVGQGLAVERVAHICHPRTDVVAVLGLQIRLSVMGDVLQPSHPVVLVSDEGYGCVPVQ